MKVLVIGANGMLGYAVSSYFEKKGDEVTKITRKDYDICKDPLGNIAEYVQLADVVINCAGVIKPRILDTPVEDVLMINSVFPRNLSMICYDWDVKFFHITTDCVYSGSTGKYSEVSHIDATDLYGLSKSAGELTEGLLMGNSIVLRTSIIGEELNSSRSLLEWAKSSAGTTVSGYINHFWNGVTTVYLAEIIEKIILEDKYEAGLYHVFSQETVSKYELLKMINSVYDLNLTVNESFAEKSCDRTLTSIYPIKNIVVKPLNVQLTEMKNFFEELRNA